MSVEAVSQTTTDDRNVMTHRSAWMGLLVFLACWLAWMAWRHEVLRLPPYDEQAVGLWREAAYLAETGFDYHGLLYDEPHTMSPQMGARSYVISVLPTLLALVMQFGPGAKFTILLTHSVTFAMATAAVLLVVWLCRQRMGLGWAALTGLAVATTPLFAVQAELVGMDMPVMLFALLAATAIARERFIMATLLSLAAFFMKANGLLVTASVWGVLLLRLLAPATIARRRTCADLAVCLVVLAIEASLIAWGDRSLDARRWVVADFGGFFGLLGLSRMIDWCPEQVVLLVVGILASVVWLARGHSALSAADHGGLIGRLRALAQLAWREPVWCFAWLLVLATLASTARYIFTPRYYSSAVPFAFLATVLPLLGLPAIRPLAGLFLLTFISFNLLNQDGRFLPDVGRIGQAWFDVNPYIRPRWSVFTERSREYLPDLRSNMAVMKQLEEHHADDEIFLAYPFTVFAAHPSMGYVERALPAHRILRYADAVSALEESAALSDSARPGKGPLFLIFAAGRSFFPAPSAIGTRLYDDHQQVPLVLYQIPWSEIPREPRAFEDWYLDQTWPWTRRAQCFGDRLDYLIATERFERAEREIDSILHQHTWGEPYLSCRAMIHEKQRARRPGSSPPD
ncbi:MAG: hypothetical protein K2Y37_09405 [Pirellulales bacterium]|nr:hypothetical protein [Pirellulales bacterium]